MAAALLRRRCVGGVRGRTRRIHASPGAAGGRGGDSGDGGGVIPAPDYRIAATLVVAAGALASQQQFAAAVPIGVLGAFLGVQTSRVRFLFGKDALEVVIGEQKESSGENAFVGGENKWAYDSFINWELWWPEFPVLVYFKEKQTKEDGQIHFFPVLFNGKELYNVMKEKCGSTMTSGRD